VGIMGIQVVAHTSRSVVVFSKSDEELSGSATMVRFTMLSTGVMTSVHTSSLAAKAILAAYFPKVMQERYEACGISTRLKMHLCSTS
jgi:hypothetical protein